MDTRGNGCLFVLPQTSVLYRLQEFHYLTSLISFFFVLSNLQECPAYKRLSSFSTLAAFPRVVKSDFVRTDIFFGSFCADRKNGDSRFIERQRTTKKKGRKSVRAIGGIVKRAMRVLNDLREPQLVELFVLPVRRMATDDARERSG